MQTLDKTYSEQHHLGSICADRSLVTDEPFSPNAFYGIDNVIKNYSGWKRGIKGVIPHGVYLGEGFLWDVEANAKVPVIFNYPQHRDAIYQARTNKLVIPFASPFLYAKAIVDNSSTNTEQRKGTLFFPVHSTHHIDAQYQDISNLIDELDSLDNRYKPITICAYWKDYLEGKYKEFERRGYQLVSAGHMFDENFLFRLYHLCLTHQYAASNILGTHVFYSMMAGCDYIHVNAAKAQQIHRENGALYISKPTGEIHEQINKYILTEDPQKMPEAKIILDSLMGTNNLKSPEDLREDLLFADRLDRYGFAQYTPSSKFYCCRPYSIERSVIHRIKPILKPCKQLIDTLLGN